MSVLEDPSGHVLNPYLNDILSCIYTVHHLNALSEGKIAHCELSAEAAANPDSEDQKDDIQHKQKAVTNLNLAFASSKLSAI